MSEDMTPEEFDAAFAAGEPVEFRIPVGGPEFRIGPWRVHRQRTWATGTAQTWDWAPR